MTSGRDGKKNKRSDSVTDRNPFVGPQSLGPEDPLFGRDWDLARLCDLLVAERIVLLYAPSGAGKTSLIDAQGGLRDRMEQEGFQVLDRARVFRELQETRPGINRYLWSLKRSLWEKPADHARAEHEDLSASLKRRCPPPDKNKPYQSWIFVIDQFEEILTSLVSDHAGKSAFFQQLGVAMTDPHLRHVWFLLAMREEYIAWLDRYIHYLPTRLDARYHLDLLTTSAAAKVITQLGAEGRPSRVLSSHTADNALDVLVSSLSLLPEHRPGGSRRLVRSPFVEPLYLQISCRALWASIDRNVTLIEKAHVKELGNLSGALTEYYEGTLAALELGGDERRVREWIDNHLILNGVHRQSVLCEDLDVIMPEPRIVEALINAHLLRAERRYHHNLVEIELAHDRLVEIISAANKRWYADNLDFFQTLAQFWNINKRPPNILLNEKELLDAEAKRPDQENLEDYEREFLSESREEVKREKERLKSEKERLEAIDRDRKNQIALERSRRIQWTTLSALIALAAIAALITVSLLEEKAANRQLTAAARQELESKELKLQEINKKLATANSQLAERQRQLDAAISKAEELRDGAAKTREEVGQ